MPMVYIRSTNSGYGHAGPAGALDRASPPNWAQYAGDPGVDPHGDNRIVSSLARRLSTCRMPDVMEDSNVTHP